MKPTEALALISRILQVTKEGTPAKIDAMRDLCEAAGYDASYQVEAK